MSIIAPISSPSGSCCTSWSSGGHPFVGDTGHEIAAAILRDQPRPLSDPRPHVAGDPGPAGLALPRPRRRPPLRVEHRSRARARRHQDGLGRGRGWTHAVESTVRTAGDWPGVCGAAAVVAARRRRLDAAAAAPASTPAAISPPSGSLVAVLPFATIGDGDAYVADGVTEAVTRELGRVKSVRVIASNTAFAYRERPTRLGRELGVGLLVRGSVQRAGGRVRINTLTGRHAARHHAVERALRPRRRQRAGDAGRHRLADRRASRLGHRQCASRTSVAVAERRARRPTTPTCGASRT